MEEVKAASILDVPVVLTSINSSGNGKFIEKIAGMVLEQKAIACEMLSFDVIEDEKFLAAIK